MKRFTAVAAVALAATLPLAACGDEKVERVGSPAVYQQIESSTDCTDLQATFDRASATFDRVEKGTQLAKAAVSYMEAADSRMRAIGCYKH